MKRFNDLTKMENPFRSENESNNANPNNPKTPGNPFRIENENVNDNIPDNELFKGRNKK
jgi:hypothetical protein